MFLRKPEESVFAESVRDSSVQQVNELTIFMRESMTSEWITLKEEKVWIRTNNSE
jgi:hypothetical protein